MDFGGRMIAASGGRYYFYMGAGYYSPRIFMSPANRVRWIAILARRNRAPYAASRRRTY
jgi:hypothetical protein